MIRANAIILTLVFSIILVKPAIPYLEYIVRKDFIIEKFCINKEKPELQCNGKCHLNKQAQKAADEAPVKEFPYRPLSENNELTVFLIETEVMAEKPYVLGLIMTYYIKSYFYQFIPDIFHPPM